MTNPTGPRGLILPFEGKHPRVASDAYIAPGAAVIGDVTVAARASIWFNCVVRGDDHFIRIGEGTNVQDGSIIHVFKDAHPTVIGANVTIGHGAILHGCTIEDESMVGIGAIVLDGAVVERGAIVAAGAVVSPGKRVPRGEMWAGCPARKVRDVKDAEAAFIDENHRHYHATALRYMALRAPAGP